MERYSRKTQDKDVNSALDFIFQNALGNIIIFEASPTISQMKANTLGYYNDELFIKLGNGELKKITLTDVP